MAVKLDYRLNLAPDSAWLTVTATGQAKASIPYIQEVGDFFAWPGYYTRRQGLNSYLIKYTLSGEGRLEYEGKAYSILPGQAFFIDCTRPQYYAPAPGADHWHILWVHFYGNSCRQYYRLFQQQNGNSPLVNLPVKFETGSLLRQMLKLFENGESSFSNDVFSSSLVTSLMTQCILGAAAPLEVESMPDYVVQARSYLMNRFRERVTLDTLAEEFAVNKYYLQKQFKRYTGLSPNEFLLSTRISRAKEMLRTGDLPVGEIAGLVGMGNTSHFIASFRKREGITPSVYRGNWYRR